MSLSEKISARKRAPLRRLLDLAQHLGEPLHFFDRRVHDFADVRQPPTEREILLAELFDFPPQPFALLLRAPGPDFQPGVFAQKLTDQGLALCNPL